MTNIASDARQLGATNRARGSGRPGLTPQPDALKRLRESLERFAPILVAVGLLIFWQVGVWWSGVSPFVLPSPYAIAARAAADVPLLASQALSTLMEIVIGFGMAIVFGVPLAFAIFYFRTFERSIYPILIGLQTLPKIALAPLLVIYLGYGLGPKIGLSFLISFLPIVIATVVGLKGLEPGLVNLIRSMGANEWQTFTMIRLPAALPNIFGGLKVAISLAVTGAIVGEYIASERGLGYLVLQANSQIDTALVFATIVTIALLGVLLYCLIAALEAKLVFQRDAAR